MDKAHPTRTLTLTAKLKDAANTKAPQLSFQRKAVHDFHSRQANKNCPSTSLTEGADSNAPSSAGGADLDASSSKSASVVPTPLMKTNMSSVVDNIIDGNDETIDQPAPCASSSCSKLTFSRQGTSAKQDIAIKYYIVLIVS